VVLAAEPGLAGMSVSTAALETSHIGTRMAFKFIKCFQIFL
jgi:hypothetical protein